MTVIDLAEVREARVSMQKAVGELSTVLLRLTEAQAERAFAVSHGLMQADPMLARGINQWVRRQLLRTVRKMLRGLYGKAAVEDVLEQCRQVYSGRLLALEDEVRAPPLASER